MTYTITDEDGQAYLLGLRQMASKSAQHTLDTLKETINDISDICLKANAGSDIGHKVLCQIRNTMSDRAATEVLFNNMLKSYREECLPLYNEHWGSFSDAAKEKLSQMYNFFCGLHLLTSMADAIAVSFKKFEDSYLECKKIGAAAISGINVFNNSSSIIRLVQNTCKAFGRGADEKNGVYRYWTVFKRKTGLDKTYFSSFRGNRFNVIFLFGGRTYFLTNKIQDFLTQHGTSNGLLKALKGDIMEPFCIAGCKVLGIINKTISAPLWRQTEKKGHILEMCKTYTGLVDFLLKCTSSEEALADFAFGRIHYFDDNLIEKDEVYDGVMTPGPYDDIALSLLQHTLLALLQLFKRVTVDYLPGGKFHQVQNDTEVRQATASAPKHNKLPERIFGYLDYLVHKRPNSTAIANEAQVLYIFNKTADFVDGKSSDELESMVKTVRSEARNMQRTAAARKEKIMDYWIKKQNEKAKELEATKMSQVQKTEQLTNDIIDSGLWQSEAQLDEYLSTMNTTKKKFDAIKRQIRFRREVLHQHMVGDKGFTFTIAVPNSTRRVDKPVEQLKSHLLLLINAAKSVGESKSVEKNPDNKYQTIPLLVGKKVSHMWVVDENNTTQWFTGTVISQVPGFRSWYNITYEGDAKVYSMRLVDDYKDETLKIII